MTCYRLRVPSGAEAATHKTFTNPIVGDVFVVDGLTGCMGLIAMAMGHPTAVLMVHDATDAYPHAKRLLEDFLSTYKPLRIEWTASQTFPNQHSWMQREASGATVNHVPHPQTMIQLTFGGTGAAPAALPPSVGEIVNITGTQLGDLDKSKPEWQKDESSDYCSICNGKFSLFNRRHHCRNCGNLVCSNCSGKRSMYGVRSLEQRGLEGDRYDRLYCDRCPAPTKPSRYW